MKKGTNKTFFKRIKVRYPISLSITILLFIIFSTYASSQAFQSPIAWLASIQKPSGSWGDPALTEVRDTIAVADVMRRVGATWTSYSSAISFINSVSAPNNDYLARKAFVLARAGIDVSTLIDEITDAQNPMEYENTLPNYPEGGWGIARGYATNNLDTILMLDTLKAVGLSGGLTVIDETIEEGENVFFEFTLPEGATSLTVYFPSLTGAIYFTIAEGEISPDGPFFYIPSAPATLIGIPVEPCGTYIIRIIGEVNSTYSFEVSYEVNGFDTRRIINAINYLEAAQNTDGGWGLSKGMESDIYITARVLETLIDYAYASDFDLDTPINNGFAWLKSKQNLDGGFGEEGSSIYITAQSYIALVRLTRSIPELDTVLVAAYNYIDSRQMPNGSWNNDAYDTAMALRIYIRLPYSIDNDWDLLTNNYETNETGTDPYNDDSDGDGIYDYREDPDSDNLYNYLEYIMGTDPQLSDTDMDGIKDGDELSMGTDPQLSDTDMDGIKDGVELKVGRNPLSPEIDDTITFEMSFQAGWHMFSLPVLLPVPTVSNVFCGGGACSGIVLFMYENNYKYVEGPDELEVDRSYWLYNFKALTLTVEGWPIWQYTTEAPENYLGQSIKGWKMIGTCSSPSVITPTNCSIKAVYTFVPGYGYKRVTSGVIEPGIGYWAYFDNIVNPATIIVEAVAP